MSDEILCVNCGWPIHWWDEDPVLATWIHTPTEDVHCHIKKATPPKKFELASSVQDSTLKEPNLKSVKGE